MSPRTTAALIAAAALASPAMGFAPGALPQFGAHRRGLRESSSSAGAVKMGLFDSILGKKEKDTSGPVVFKEWSQKDVVDGPKGAGLQGDIACLFKIGDEEKPTTAFAGQPLSDVATQVRVKHACFRCSAVLARRNHLRLPLFALYHLNGSVFLAPDDVPPPSFLAPLPLALFSSLLTTQANAFIPYKCKKGECGTCDVLINGKWVHACQTTIPLMAKGEVFQVNIREVSCLHQT